jgi:hypothetical protein
MKKCLFVSSLALIGLCTWTLDLHAAESSPQESHAGASPRVILAVNRYDVSSSRPEFDQRKTSGL